MKKFLSVILVLVMCLGIAPISAFAAENAETAAVTENWIDSADITWYNDTDIEFTIDTAEKLAGLASIVNAGTDNFQNKTIILGADIDLAGKEWTPIGTLDANIVFMGTLKGENNIISNLTINQDYGTTKARVGLFSGLQGIKDAADITFAKVEDVIINGANITISGNNARAGALAGNVWSGTYINNVDVNDATFTSIGVSGGTVIVGGLCAYGYTSMFEGVDISGIKINHSGEGFAYLGGMTGNTAGHESFWTAEQTNTFWEDCNVASATITSSAAGSVYIGGFGNATSYGGSTNQQENCDVSVNMTLSGDAQYTVGGFMGYESGMGYDKSCTVTGTITSTGTNVASSFGGFFGSRGGRGRGNTENKSHSGHTANVGITVSAGNVGGFAGALNQHSENVYVFDGCTVKGDVATNNGIAGGFIGNVNSLDGGNSVHLELNSCSVSNTVKGTTYAGGLVGYINPMITAGTTENVIIKQNCTPSESVTGDTVHNIANLPDGYYLDGESDTEKYVICKTFEDVSIALGTDITAKYYVAKNNFTDLQMRFTINSYSVTVSGTLEGEQYLFEFAGVAPQWIGDTIKAELIKDGEVIAIKNYSVLEYLNSLKAQYSADTKMKTLINDLLVYGGAAQTYRGYNTHNLVSDGVIGTEFASITEDMKAYIKQGDIVTFTTATVNFSNVNKLKFKFSATDLTGVTFKLSVNGADENEVSYVANGNVYMIVTNAISATGFNDKYTLTAYNADGEVDAILTYSVASYVYSKQNANSDMSALAKALYNYGQSAIAYATADN